MGGSLNGIGNIKPYAEFNFFVDPDAVRIVLDSGANIVISPIELGFETTIEKTLPNTRKNTTKREILIKNLFEGAFDRYKEGYFCMHDANTSLLLLAPECYTLSPCDIDFVDKGEFAGQCFIKPNKSGKFLVQLIKNNDTTTVKNKLIEYFYGDNE